MAWQEYRFEATVIRIIDGDTLEATVDLGFSMFHRMKVRLARINAPEMRGKEAARALDARTRLEALCPPGKPIKLQTYKDGEDKYGRYLADVYQDKSLACVNDTLVSEGLADYRAY